MKETVPVAQATPCSRSACRRLSAVGGGSKAKEGLLALSAGVGLGVLSEMLEEEVDEVVGPKGKWDRERTAVRHGHDDGEVTLGDWRVPVRRPRVRTAGGSAEIPLQRYERFGDRDPLARIVLERMLAGVSTRRYERNGEKRSAFAPLFISTRSTKLSHAPDRSPGSGQSGCPSGLDPIASRALRAALTRRGGVAHGPRRLTTARVYAPHAEPAPGATTRGGRQKPRAARRQPRCHTTTVRTPRVSQWGPSPIPAKRRS